MQSGFAYTSNKTRISTAARLVYLHTLPETGHRTKDECHRVRNGWYVYVTSNVHQGRLECWEFERRFLVWAGQDSVWMVPEIRVAVREVWIIDGGQSSEGDAKTDRLSAHLGFLRPKVEPEAGIISPRKVINQPCRTTDTNCTPQKQVYSSQILPCPNCQ